MLVTEAKLLNGKSNQYKSLDEAIRTAQFIRNKAVRYWIDNQGVDKSRLYKLSKELANEFAFVNQLNSSARQASVEVAWTSISNFYRRCKQGAKKKGYPKFKKHCRSVEYKQSGWKLSDDCMFITFTDKFKSGKFSLYCNSETREDLFRLKINRVRIVRRADGYYCQFCLDADRKESGNYNGNVIGIDLGLKYFYKDQKDNAVVYPQYLRKSEKKLKRRQRQLSRKFVKGKKLCDPASPTGASGQIPRRRKTQGNADQERECAPRQPQSNNYHKARKRLGLCHLKVSRQRKDWSIKQARCVVASNDVVVYEDLKIQNMVKNHHLAKSISDAAWYQFTQWLEYYGKIWDKSVVAVNPKYTSQDCSNCGHRVKKTLSTRTHVCPSCHVEICRDTNAAQNILNRGLEIIGIEWNQGTVGHTGTS